MKRKATVSEYAFTPEVQVKSIAEMASWLLQDDDLMACDPEFRLALGVIVEQGPGVLFELNCLRAAQREPPQNAQALDQEEQEKWLDASTEVIEDSPPPLKRSRTLYGEELSDATTVKVEKK